MLLPLRFWAVASRFPGLFTGDSFHRAGLDAATRREFSLADTLFEAAALRYRDDLMVPALARLRAHQLMARAVGCFDEDHDAALEYSDEAARRLQAIDIIDDRTLVDDEYPAADLLAVWTSRFSGARRALAA